MARGRGRGRGRGRTSISLKTPNDQEISEDLDDSQETSNAEEDELETDLNIKVDRRKPQLKNKQNLSQTLTSQSSVRRPGRPPKRGRGANSSAQNTINRLNNNSNNNNNNNDINSSEVLSDGENSESQGENSCEPMRKRGRKPKEPIKAEDRYVPNTDSSKRGIMAEGGGGSLRRRDQIKSKARYSPPPFDTPKRERGSAIKFPSTTSSSSRYVTESDDEEMVSVSPTFKLSSDVSPPRRKSNQNRITQNDSTTVVHTLDNVGVSRIADGSKLVVTLPDGSSIKVDASSASANKKVAFKGTKKLANKQMESIEIDFDDDGAQDDPLDDDYKPSRARKKAEEIKKEVENKPKIISTYSRVTPKQAITTTKLMPVSQLKSPLASNSTIGSKIIPKFVTTTQPNRQQTQRRTATQMTKYIDVLPELHECTYDIDTDISMAKLPDKILLLHSELPLKLALSVEHDDEPYLFRQIISPMESNRYVCLLCKGIDVSYATKEEKDILSHYRTLHELEVVTANAKFSEDIVFICLPKAILQQLTSSSSLIPLNAPCQYCGDDIRLLNIDEMKDHYSSTHNKEVVMIEQEEILKMHLFFYCSKCKHQSQDFDSHHKHMKDEHKFKSYKCKSCVLITQDVTRLKTHFRAKHMINSSNQNMQCYYCHGLLIGLDRLNKHIQQSHMVQTGPTEFSCVACLKPCGRGKDLLVHAQNCSQTVSVSGSGSNSNSATTVGNASKLDNHKEDKSQVTLVKREEESDGSEAICFLCGDEFESNTICELHQHHVHMKWVSDLRRYTNASEQIQLQIKELTIDDLTPEQDLRKAKVDTIVGHWCRMCDQMVKVYRLFYLHMANYHKLDKEFQCNVSNCKAQFNSPETFQEHMLDSGHNQKTIITHPDEVFVCTYCDLYFGTDEELVSHLITDQHINKFTASGHFHRTEPRNYKCKACHTFFGMKESYIHHLESEPHQYACPYCGISTATPSSRRAHIQNSHPDKLQICEECNEPQSDVLAHFVTHGFAFECKKCIKKFYNREQLNAHMEAHQDPIVCNWENCGKTIATRSMLVTHYRNHKSEHKCTVCGQAFWNINMLNSHQRSHQSVQRIQPSTLSPTKPTVGRPSTKTPIIQSISSKNESQQSIKLQSPLSTTIKSKTGPIPQSTNVSKPQVSNTVIKCGHCSALFKNAKDLAGHKCVKSTQIKHEILPEESKLLELAAKAAAAVKPQQSPKSPRGRRQSPKKQISQQQQPVIDLNALTAAQGIGNQSEDGTQVIMILNQESGELMEITAPQGMAVSEVISSLNFVRPAATEVTTLSSTSSSSDAFGQQQQQQQQQLQLQQQSATGAAQEQTIMLPANCFNEDGSLTLDAATLSSLNLAIAVDGNGELTTDGNTTFIIDTSNSK